MKMKLKFASLFLSLLLGCTVTPTTVRDNTIRYEGGAQTAGFLGFTSFEGQRWGVISAAKQVEYNALIARYGTNPRWIVPLTNNFGLAPYTNGTWLISKEALVNFGVLNEMHRK